MYTLVYIYIHTYTYIHAHICVCKFIREPYSNKETFGPAGQAV